MLSFEGAHDQLLERRRDLSARESSEHRDRFLELSPERLAVVARAQVLIESISFDFTEGPLARVGHELIGLLAREPGHWNGAF